MCDWIPEHRAQKCAASGARNPLNNRNARDPGRRRPAVEFGYSYGRHEVAAADRETPGTGTGFCLDDGPGPVVDWGPPPPRLTKAREQARAFARAAIEYDAAWGPAVRHARAARADAWRAQGVGRGGTTGPRPDNTGEAPRWWGHNSPQHRMYWG